MTKKIFIGAIVFFVIAAGAAVYLLFFRQPASQSQNQSGQSGNISNGAYQSFPVAPSNNQAPVSATSTASTSSTSTPSVVIQTLTHLYTLPIAGAGIVSGKGGESVRLTDRATGHMYLISLASSSLGQITEISDQTLPEMYESLWLGASTTILRYLDSNETTIKTYSASLTATKSASSTSLSTIAGSFLPDDIEGLAANPAGSQIFYLVESADGATGKISKVNGTGASGIFTSALSDWNVQWPTTATIALSTKASSVARGYLYFLSTTGTVKRILGDVPGMVTVVDPTASFVAYSDSTPSLSIFNIKSDTSQSTNLNTIADKCVWSEKQSDVLYCAVPDSIPTGHYPDAWYQGLVSFSDSIYRIDANTGQTSQIADLGQQAGQAIDVENLNVAPNDDYLIFTNKIDLSLWSLQLQPTI